MSEGGAMKYKREAQHVGDVLSLSSWQASEALRGGVWSRTRGKRWMV